MTLLIYFILTSAHRWEFLAVEHVDSPELCEYLAKDVNKAFSNKPGNMRIVCAGDTNVEAMRKFGAKFS